MDGLLGSSLVKPTRGFLGYALAECGAARSPGCASRLIDDKRYKQKDETTPGIIVLVYRLAYVRECMRVFVLLNRLSRRLLFFSHPRFKAEEETGFNVNLHPTSVPNVPRMFSVLCCIPDM